MKQALHIFRKDVRRLWPRVVIVLVVMVIHAFLDVRSSPVNFPQTARVNTALSVLHMLLPLGIWFLIAWVIFQEPLPGDRQFWLTRPYRWPALLASKVFFVFMFVSVPLLISDCYILGAQNFPVVSVFPRLLLRQLFVAALFILPSFAIATVTNGVSQFLLGWFALVFALICEVTLPSLWTSGSGVFVGFTTLDNSVFAAMVVVAAGTVIWQYAARRTNLARLVLSTTICVFPLFWLVPPLLHLSHAAPQRAHLPDRPAVQLAYDLSRSVPSSTFYSPPEGFLLARIPLTVSGLPPKTLLRGTGEITIQTAGKTRLDPGISYFGSIERLGGDYFQSMNLPRPLIEALKGQPANIQTAFELEIVTDEIRQREPLKPHVFKVAGLGLCLVIPDSVALTCRAGLGDSTETVARLDSAPDLAPPAASFGPHTIPWGLSPTSDLGVSSFPTVPLDAQLVFIPHRQITRFGRTLDLHDVRLVDFLVPREDR
ncbi:MAG: hypothetical protein WBW33_13770 [Bryobacteraceae bacterium]